MGSLGNAAVKLGKNSVIAAAEDRTVDPPRKTLATGKFNGNAPYTGHLGATDRYYFPGHPGSTFITGYSAGHGMEDEILRRVGRHPSDPLGLKAVGVDNATWEPTQEDVLDMAYIQWENGRSLYSVIDGAGGLLDRLNLRDVPTPGSPGEDVAALREQLDIAHKGWTAATQEHERQTLAIRASLKKVKITSAGGKPMAALREIRDIVK
jgi:hypothetical protein